MNRTGIIFAVKPFSLHDGPNLRTTVFFKGCPLKCRWCHNPEGISFSPSVVSMTEKCVGCGECVRGCSSEALVMTAEGVHREVDRCSLCLQCVELCPALVHEPVGYRVKVEELIAEIAKDIAFFDQSGGGVTFSGGEPLAQPEFLMGLLEACGHLSIHRTVDTSAYASSETLMRVAEQTDLFLCDLKHMDDGIHREVTGVGNGSILENIRLLCREGRNIRVRIPLIPGINDSNDNLLKCIDFIHELRLESIDLLPYHNAAGAKYDKLEQPYPGETIRPATQEDLARAVDIFRRNNIETVTGG